MPVRGHSWDYWQKKLMDEQGYDEETANKVIGSWEKEESTEANPCWDGYEQIGMKDKDGKQVPNCVPKSDETSLNTTDDQDDSKSLSTKSRGMYEEGIVDKIENLADKFGIKLDRDEEQIDESMANEEGLASVSGPPTGTEPTVIEDEESLADTRVGGDLGKELGDTQVESHDPIMLNESYLQYENVLYRPVYAGESIDLNDDSILIFENKYYTSEGTGNCPMCKGAGKVTVERLGLKECPKCDGSGDIQPDPQPQISDEPIFESKAEEEGTSDGAKKGWATRKGSTLMIKRKNTNEDNLGSIWKNADSNTLKQWMKDQKNNPEQSDNYKAVKKVLEDRGVSVESESDYTETELYDALGHFGIDPSGAIGNYPESTLKKLVNDWKKESQESKANEDWNFPTCPHCGSDWVPDEGNPYLGAFYTPDEVDKMTGDDMMKCNYCGKSFTRREYNATSYESKANENKEWECKDCGVKTSNPTQHQKDTGHNNIEKIPSFRGCINCGSPVQEPYYMEDYVECKNCGTHFKFLEAKSLESKAKESWFKDKGDSTTCLLCGKSMVSSMKSEHMIHHKIGESLVEDENYNKKFIKAVEACGCKKNAYESIKKYKSFIDTEINVLKKRAKAGEAVGIMYGLPTIRKNGRKIKGTLAYAGVSLNDRIYLPEELAKGHGKTLPLLLNHSSTAGAEEELDRLDDEMLHSLENDIDYQVGEVTLTWVPEELTLYYEGVVENEFFQKEIDDMGMAVSLGIYYDSDSPKVCDEECYTLIKGAEFREVSLVYHAGFPIATIEAVEAELKRNSKISIAKEEVDKILPDGSIDTSPSDVEPVVEEPVLKEAIAEEEEDPLPKGGSIDAEPKPPIDTPVFVESFYSPDSFSIRGVSGMTISNSNGVERYSFDPTQNYSTNTIHFNVIGEGATIFGEQLQPKMATSDDITKEIESKPDIEVKDSDEDFLKKN